MKTCPNCNEVNGDNNAKCFKCGAVLPMLETQKDEILKKIATQQAETVTEKSNSKRISDLATAVAIIGIIISVILGFIFQVETIKNGTYSYTVEKMFNWTLCISVALGAICFTILLMAMSYIAKAIEEK